MAENTAPKGLQDRMERNVWGLLIVLAIALSVGGIVEIVPLFYLKSTMEHNKYPEIVWIRLASNRSRRSRTIRSAELKPGDGVRPYTALDWPGGRLSAGGLLYMPLADGPFRDEKERYATTPGSTMFDHPFQWGSRTGPDWRLGGTDEWHRAHLRAPARSRSR
jgi:cytochrome c oxidase cbb3-type subunit 2